MTDPTIHGRAKCVFVAVRQLPATDREAALVRLCGDDAALLAHVEALLVQDDRTDAPLDRPLLGGHVDLDGIRVQATPAALPDEIGGHQILAKLGDGGMGVVYLARQDPPGRDVALKVLRSVAPTREQIDRLRREAGVLARLHHPGIAQIHEVGQHTFELGDQPFLVLEMVRGQPLLEYAKACDLGVRERITLFATVCEAIGHAHTEGVVHRDLKPGHILVDRDGRARVIDFGIAKSFWPTADLDSMTRTGSVLGTPQYASPEQLHGDEIGPASDVYSLGLLLFELLAGHAPYRVDSARPSETLRVVCAVPPDPKQLAAAGVDGELRAVILRALEKSPVRRYPDGGALGDDLRRYLAGEGVAARPPGRCRRIVRWSRRRPLAAVTLLALVLASATLSGLTWQHIDAARRHAGRASAAWLDGDLASIRRELAMVPTWAERWLTDSLRSRAPDLRTSPGDDALARVVTALEKDSAAAARLLASRFLERDGASSHPELLRFLIAAIRAGNPTSSHALRLCGRVFFERPDESPAATRASQPLRELLEGYHYSDLTHSDRLLVMVALGGCGVAHNLDMIRRWCDAAIIADLPGAQAEEETRVYATTLASIARRGRACGDADEWLLHRPDRALTSLGNAYAAPHLRGGNLGSRKQSLAWALLADAYARRWSGVTSSNSDRIPAVLGSMPQLRAARRHPDLIRALERDPAFLLPPVRNREAAHRRLRIAGYVLETSGIRARRPGVVAALLTAAQSYQLPQTLAAEFFNLGVRAAQDAAAGRRGDYDPDADTHLGAWFAIHTQTLQPLAVIVEDAPPNVLARWTVGHHAVRVAGTATRAAWRNVRIIRDDFDPDSWNARLGPAGAAEIVLEFDQLEPGALKSALLEVQAIKATRAYLPYFGEVSVTIDIDGAAVAQLDIVTTAWDPVSFPMSVDQLGPGPHRLRIALDPNSTTTARIRAVTIARPAR